MPVADWLPQRYSVGDADFNPELSRHLSIYLDGVKQDMVTEYDIPGGWLTRLATDPDGYLVVDRTKGEVVNETLHGSVTVDWQD